MFLVLLKLADKEEKKKKIIYAVEMYTDIFYD